MASKSKSRKDKKDRIVKKNESLRVEDDRIQPKSNVDLLSDLGVQKLKAVLIKPKIKFPDQNDTQNMSRKAEKTNNKTHERTRKRLRQNNGNNNSKISISTYQLRQKNTTRKSYELSSDDDSSEDGQDESNDETSIDDEERMLLDDKWFINDDEEESEVSDSYSNTKRDKKKSKSHSSRRSNSKREPSKARKLQHSKKKEAVENGDRVLRQVKPGFVYKNAMDIKEIDSDSEGEKSAHANNKQYQVDGDSDSSANQLLGQLDGNASDSSVEFVGKILDMAKKLNAMNDESEGEDQVGDNIAKIGKKGRTLRRMKRRKSEDGSSDSDNQREDVKDDLKWLEPSYKKRKQALTITLDDDDDDDDDQDGDHELSNKVVSQHSSDEDSIESDKEHLNRENIFKKRTRGKQASKFQEALSKLRDRRDKDDSDQFVLLEDSSDTSINDESDTDDDKDEDEFVVDDNIIDGVRMTENEEVMSELNREQMPAEFSASRLKSWTSQYKIYIEYLVYRIIAGSKSQKTDITNRYDVARNAVEKRILGYRDSISTSDAWKPQFKAAMDKYPIWINNDSFPSSSFECQACRHHPNHESRIITLCSEDGEGDGTIFYVGTHCHGRGHMYHYLTHFEFHMNQNVKSEIENRKYRSKFSDKKNLSHVVDEVFRKLLMSGFIKKSYNDFRVHIIELTKVFSLKRHRLELEEYSEDEDETWLLYQKD